MKEQLIEVEIIVGWDPEDSDPPSTPRRVYGKNRKTAETGSAYVTPPELAKAIGVDHKTVLNWIRSGLLKGAAKSPGGHHRIERDEAKAFIERYGYDMPGWLTTEAS